MNVFVNPRLASYGAQAQRKTKARIKQLLLGTQSLPRKRWLNPIQSAVLEVRNLHVVYETDEGPVKAVNDVSFN